MHPLRSRLQSPPSYLDHDDTNAYVRTHPIPFDLTRSHYLGPRALPLPGVAPLAYLPSLHPKRFITLERPVSMRFGYPPAIKWSGDMICRCGVAESAADSFWAPSLDPASFSGGFLPGRWRFSSLFVTLVGTASPQYNRS